MSHTWMSHVTHLNRHIHNDMIPIYMCLFMRVTWLIHVIWIQPISDRVAQHLEIISKNFQLSTRRTRILMGFIIYYLVLIVNPMGRILVRRQSFGNNLEMLCHPFCNWLYVCIVSIYAFDILHIYMCKTTYIFVDSCVWRDSFIFLTFYTYICVKQLTTNSLTNPVVSVKWLIYVCDTPDSYGVATVSRID